MFGIDQSVFGSGFEVEVGAGGPAGHADLADDGIFGNLVADFDIDLVEVGVKGLDLVLVTDNDFVAVAEAANFDLGDGASGGGENRGFAGSADVNAGMETVKSLGIAAGLSQRHPEGGFGQDIDGILGQNGDFGSRQGQGAADGAQAVDDDDGRGQIKAENRPQQAFFKQRPEPTGKRLATASTRQLFNHVTA